MTGRKSKARRVRPMYFLRVGVFGMSQRAFAKIIDVPQRTISGYEIGEPADDDTLPIFVLRRARLYALSNRIDWPPDFCDRLVSEPCLLIEK